MMLASCSHDFTRQDASTSKGPSGPDVDDRDSDGAVDLLFTEPPPDTAFREGGPFDLGFPDGCTAANPNTSGSCSELGSWTCITKCGDFDRMACNDGTLRELRCNSLGECQCKVGTQPPSPCLGMLNNGRTGCTRTREVFKQGCCNP